MLVYYDPRHGVYRTEDGRAISPDEVRMVDARGDAFDFLAARREPRVFTVVTPGGLGESQRSLFEG